MLLARQIPFSELLVFLTDMPSFVCLHSVDGPEGFLCMVSLRASLSGVFVPVGHGLSHAMQALEVSG